LFYDANGYLILDNMVTPLQLTLLRGVAFSVIGGSHSFFESNGISHLDVGHTPRAPGITRVNQPHLIEPAFLDMLRKSRMADILTELLGADAILHGCTLRSSPPTETGLIAWRQDWALGPRSSDRGVTLGLLLEDVDTETGADMVVPGSHKGPILSHVRNGVFNGTTRPEECGIDLSTAIPLTGKAGTVTLHHCRTLHGPAPNTGKQAGFALYFECSIGDARPFGGPCVAGGAHQAADREPTAESRGSPDNGGSAQRWPIHPVRFPLPRDSELHSRVTRHGADDLNTSCAA
jgi:hypothetical protein